MIKIKIGKPFYFLLLIVVVLGCKSDSEIEENEVFETITVTTFNKAHLGFSSNLNQNVEQTFDFPVDNEKIKEILMYVKLDCPSGGCGAWMYLPILS